MNTYKVPRCFLGQIGSMCSPQPSIADEIRVKMISEEKLVTFKWQGKTDIECLYIFKYFSNMTPYYIGELFENHENRSTSTRNSFLKLKQPSVKTNFGKKALFYTAPVLWNKLKCEIKQCKSVNSFKHAIKRNLFEELGLKEKDIYLF